MRRLCLALILVPGVVFSQTNSDPLALVPESVRATLVSKGETHEWADKPENLTMLRGAPQADALTKGFIVNGNLAAALYAWVPLPPGADRARIVRALTSVSTMKGLQVYSESLKRMETFIFDAYRVESVTQAAPLADPVSEGSSMKFLFFQNEEQTGKGFVEESLSPLGDGFLVRLVNKTALNYGPVPLVAAGELQTALVVIPGKDHVLLIGTTVAKTWSLFGLERSRASSLYNRMNALVTWFGNNLSN